MHPSPNNHQTIQHKKTEEAIEQTKDRLKEILNGIDDGITLVDLDGKVVDCNQASLKLLGLIKKEFVGTNVYDIIIPEDREKAVTGASEVLRTGKTVNVVRVKRKNSSNFWAEISVNALYDKNGNPTLFLGVTRDITERKNAEEALKENEERLVIAQGVARLGSWEFLVKEDRATWSKTMFEIFGLEHKTAPNIAAYSKLIHPDDLKMVATTMQQLIAFGKLGEKVSFDYRIVRPDNEVCYLHSERMIRDVDSNGKAVRIIGIEQDITERKVVEESLRESEERFRLVAEAAKVMVYEIQFGTDDVKVFSGEDVLGYNKREMVCSNTWWFSQIHKDDIERVEEESKKGIFSGQEFMLEYRVKRKQGDYVFVHDTVRVVRDRHGNIVRLIGGLRDVTRRKQNEDAILKSKEQLELKTAEVQKYATSMEQIAQERANKLRAAERLAAIGATAGMVGHDIRNPLQAMVSDVYIMREEIASKCICDHKNELIESLVGIDENISYINKIVQDLQDYARPITPEYSTVDLSNVLVKVFETVRVPESVKLSIKVKDLDRLRIDRMLLQRALSNLITNAIQAMPLGGTLEVTGHLEENKVTIIVADTGVGIPDEVKPKLFTPMMTTKSKGQGFGLAVSKRLIEVMKGTITFESEKGKGTKFIIELPTSL